MPTHTFTTPDPVALVVSNGSGRVTVRVEETDQTVVDVAGKHADDVEVTHDGDAVIVTPPRLRGGLFGDTSLTITVTAPVGSRPELRVGSADVDVHGPVGATAVRSGSGDIVLDSAAGDALVETGSGSLRVGSVDGDLRVKSGSGDVVIADAAGSVGSSSGSGDLTVTALGGTLSAKTGSGDVDVVESRGEVTLKTGSGSLTVREAHRGRVRAKGASGDVRVGIARGVPVWTDVSTVSGHVRSELDSLGAPADGADHVEVAATTVSGDVHLRHL